MEAATLPARPAVKGDRLRAFIGTYGLTVNYDRVLRRRVSE